MSDQKAPEEKEYDNVQEILDDMEDEDAKEYIKQSPSLWYIKNYLHPKNPERGIRRGLEEHIEDLENELFHTRNEYKIIDEGDRQKIYEILSRKNTCMDMQSSICGKNSKETNEDKIKYINQIMKHKNEIITF